MCGVEALLVPAVNEPFGRTLIEAMLLGTPVVATDHGGNPEAINDRQNGYLVKPEDPEAFVEPIHSLLTDPQEWQRISETARAGALTDYGVDMHIEGITRIYERMTS
jgi:glycosyltransferase involved in cell wall biosynthesis